MMNINVLVTLWERSHRMGRPAEHVFHGHERDHRDQAEGVLGDHPPAPEQMPSTVLVTVDPYPGAPTGRVVSSW